MKPEFSGIERRLEKHSVCLNKLELDINWDEVYNNLHQLNDISKFMKQVKGWMKAKASNEKPKD